jgi:uncharacterized glyoxalase superfamily protein PhnB
MNLRPVLAAVLLALVSAGISPTQQIQEPAMKMKKLTPVLIVDSIEPCLAFWVGKLGFTKTVEVPGPDGKTGFVILTSGPVELMYQSRASVAADVPSFAKEPTRATLYLEVESLDSIRKAIAGLPVVVPERTTFYGAKEIGVREPGGHFVTFAEVVDGK